MKMLYFIYHNIEKFFHSFHELLGSAVHEHKKYFFLDCTTCLLYVFTFVWIFFDPFIYDFQFYLEYPNTLFSFGLDGISLFFIYLSVFLISLCLLYSIYNYRFTALVDFYLYSGCFFSLLVLLILIFSTLDFLFFYICFELVLLPFFIIIGIGGYRKRRIFAMFLFFFYTLLGSLLMLTGIILIYSYHGDTHYDILLHANYFSVERERFVWLLLFFSFAIKVPIFPFHIWLPEAHVEAPTEGSVVLAGILLKLGTYGILRFLLPIMPNASYYFSPLVLLLCTMGMFYTSLVTLRQVDIKRIIAYSSVSHMNMCIAGLFSFNIISVMGSYHLMIGHGLVSGGLFFLIGMLYTRYNTKIIKYYGGLIYTMPLFSFFFFIYTICNMSFPLTCNFIGEMMILIGMYNSYNYVILFFSCISIFIATIYSIWLYNKIVFLLPKYNYQNNQLDLNLMEIVILSMILIFILFLGIYPNSLFSTIELSINNYLFSLLNN